MRLAAFSIGLCATCLAGCESEWDLTVDVRVPAEVQAAFEDKLPAELLVRGVVTGKAKSGDGIAAARLAVLCEASDADQLVRSEYSAAGCRSELQVQAWLAPLKLEDGAKPTCGVIPPTVYLESPVEPSDDEPRAESLAFDGQGKDDCDGASDRVTLTLSVAE